MAKEKLHNRVFTTFNKKIEREKIEGFITAVRREKDVSLSVTPTVTVLETLSALTFFFFDEKVI